ncbi:hypothetical protein Dvina_32150 [Dactylosporangium vinaceum]|uniref:Integral membrane protein n=1 Tax=Dactylosporangium vinaceum TaxID=53362 RepID=A0ABV5MAK9_9ACTN|nr:hypothetical protein [Dactylosporangium vinaceum]UAB92949.1 hypothetical protein Dvina_32150 [Dactylosporangium vinaceum]
MGLLTRTIHACLRAGGRRWPAELRDQLTQEWLAELAALEGEPHGAWRRLRFAVSLAASPVTYDEHGLPSGRWERWRTPGRVLRTAAGLLLAGALGVGLWATLNMLLGFLVMQSDAGYDQSSFMRRSFVAAAVSAGLTSAYAAAAGWWLGGGAAGGRGAGNWGRAGLAAVALGAVFLAWTPSLYPGFNGDGPKHGSTMIAVWVLVTFAAAVVVAGRVAAGQPGLGWAAGLAGVLLAAVLPVMAAMPRTTLGGASPARWELAALACQLLPSAVCAVAFGWAAARPRPAGLAPGATVATVAAGQPVVDGGARDRRLVTTPAAMAAAAMGVAVLWAMQLWADSSDTNWARDLRWDAIVAMVLAVVVCARGQRRVTVEALVGGLVWLAADTALDRAGLSHASAPLAVGAASVAALGCYRGVTGRGAPQPAALPVVAGVAAMLAGVNLLAEPSSSTGPTFHVGSAVVSGALGLIAVGAAFSTAVHISRLRFAVYCLSSAVAVTTPWLLRERHILATNSDRLLHVMGLTALLTVCAVIVARPRPRRLRQWLRYPAAASIALLMFPLVGLPVITATRFLDIGPVFTALAGRPVRPEAFDDYILTVPALLSGLVLGSLVLGRAHRSDSVA